MVVERERESVERGMSRPKTIDGSGPDKSRREAEISLFSSCAVRGRMVFWVKATRGRGRS